MRGFLSLEPDDATLARLVGAQNRLRDGLARQGVHFPDRLGPTLLAWPFGTLDEVGEAAKVLQGFSILSVGLSGLRGVPNNDRPAEVGFGVEGVAAMQSEMFTVLKTLLDPDPPKMAFIRLARVSPPSRKVGAALRELHPSPESLSFVPNGIGLWTQTPQGFELRHKIALKQD